MCSIHYVHKFFCNTDFERNFPLAFVTAKSRASSDHVPLILNCGINTSKKPAIFRFEKWWLDQPDFREIVTKIWKTSCVYTDPMEIWQFKIRLLSYEAAKRRG